MRQFNLVAVVILISSANPVLGLADEASFGAMLDRLLPGMGAEELPDRAAPQQEFQEACRQLGRPGREAERAVACKTMASRLGPETAKPARVWMLRQLMFIGRGECVDAVAEVLDDKDLEVRTYALWVLQKNPATEANARLLANLENATDTEWIVGLINALGYRAAPESCDGLVPLLGSTEESIVAAAANALGQIGGSKAIKALAAADSKASPAIRRRIGDAYLRCADRLLQQGEGEQAIRMYRMLNTPEQPRPIRLAAQQGLLNAGGGKIDSMVFSFLAGNDPDGRALAAGHLAKVRDTAVWKSLVEVFPKLPPAGQILLLGALAARGDKSAAPLAVAAARSDNLDLQLAGLRALAKLGDASDVPLLIESLFREGPASAAARESLQQVFGEGVEESIVAALKRDQGSIQREQLIDVLGTRDAVVAVPAIIEEVGHKEGNVRLRAIRALGRLGAPTDVPAMIQCLLRAEGNAESDAIQKAIVSVCNQVEDEQRRAEPVTAVLASASLVEKIKILPLLGRIGSQRTLSLVREAAASNDAQLQAAGVRALANWPNADVADDLIRLAKDAGEQRLRIWALRGYVRVISVPDFRPDHELLAMFNSAMLLAERNEEKNLILMRASSARDVETLRWVVPYLDRQPQSHAACQAVVDLAHHRELVKANRAEFIRALERVVSLSTDQRLIDRARLYMQQ